MQIESTYDKEAGELSWICPKCKERYTVPGEKTFHRSDLFSLANEAKSRCIRCGTKYSVRVGWDVVFYHMHHHPIKHMQKRDLQSIKEDLERINREGV